MPRTSARLRPKFHKKAGGTYSARSKVPSDKVDWKVAWGGYKPTEIDEVSKEKVKPAWADPYDVSEVQELPKRISFEGPLELERESGRPVNPRGRTGVVGRGQLGKWGPNHAADPIVTRFDPGRPGVKQFVAIRRKDNGQWAIPGGMVDGGEAVSATVRREFTEEAGAIADPAQREAFERFTDQLFAKGRIVYEGYVDDPRNTDHAWMETTAFHFHCPDALAKLLPLTAGDDASEVMWLDIDTSNAKYADLYASHKDWVDEVGANMKLPRATQKQLASAIGRKRKR